MNPPNRENGHTARFGSTEDEARCGPREWLGDSSGAFADCESFLTLVFGFLQCADPTGVLVGPGVFPLTMAPF